MGRASTKANKNIYQQSREERRLTRAQASEAMGFLSESQIERIEYGKIQPHPEDVMAMAAAYNNVGLCNYYCANECPIGQQYVPSIEIKDLPQIVLEMLASLNSIYKQKDRLIEITVDGQVSDDELRDFAIIQDQLAKIAISVNALQYWVEGMVASGKIDKSRLEELRAEHH